MRRRHRGPFRRLERGSWVTTDLMDALRGVDPAAVVLFLYARSLTGKSRFTPDVSRLSRIMGVPVDVLVPAYEAAARAGLFTDQWLGSRNLFRAGRRAFVTVRALNELREKLPDEDILVLVRYMPYLDEDGKLRISRHAIAERARIPRGTVMTAFDHLRESEILSDDGRFAGYLL